MKVQITNYTFNKTAKTITFNDYAYINLESILTVLNVTRNIIIYNPINNNDTLTCDNISSFIYL